MKILAPIVLILGAYFLYKANGQWDRKMWIGLSLIAIGLVLTAISIEYYSVLKNG